MKIEKFRINNFKSIIESNYIKLEEDLTILLGKNEAGKTSILKALESFRTDFEFDIDDLSLHSNDGENYRKENLYEDKIPVVTIYFQIESDDKAKLEKINPEFKNIQNIKCTKYYDNHYEIAIPELNIEYKEDLEENEEENEEEKKEKYLTEIHELTKSFKEQLDIILSDSPYKTFKEDYTQLIDQILLIDQIDNIDELDYHKKLREISDDDEILNEINKFSSEIEFIKNKIKKIRKPDIILDQILDILPNFMYFSTIDILQDEAEWGKLKENPGKYKTLINLLKLSNIDFEDIEDFEDRSVLTEVRNGTAKISGLINESWTQEEIELDTIVTNNKVIISIKDDKVKQYYNPSVRSQGFQWFLSFYINFTVDSEELKNTIILLDDPGIYLHASGQKDLIKTLEKISNSNQIIITTHSPFMIDIDRLERIRLVSNLDSKGTKVNEKFHKSNYDAFAPIRASIGMTLGDSLFIGHKTLMVEGITDNILIRPMSELLSKKNLNYIDTSKIAILSVNSADKSRFFIPFVLSEEIAYVVLLDFDDKGNEIKRKLIEEFGNINIMMYDEVDVLDSNHDLAIEDLFDFEFYLKAVNNCYKDIFKDRIGNESLNDSDITTKSFRGIKNYFRTHNELGDFDKVLVAKEISKMIRNGDIPNDHTIQNFSEFYKLINNKLK